MTTRAGSGHLTSSLSAVQLMASLYFSGKLKFDLKNPNAENNDRVIFSKGHAVPLLYALYKVAGVLSEKDINSFRQIGSKLEGHPRPVFEFAEAATGSLGQGLSVGAGMALASKIDDISNFIYVLLGDSEFAEGSIWEALQFASYYKLDNLVGILDVNRLGQSGETMLGWDVETYKNRIESFGWEVHIVDGHDTEDISKAYTSINLGSGRPQMIVAKTIKGKGVPFLEDKDGWHGKALSQEQLKEALFALGEIDEDLKAQIEKPKEKGKLLSKVSTLSRSALNLGYKIGDKVATRKAYGEAISNIGDDSRIICLDAEVKNSTYAEIFEKKYKERFFQMFIAEQNMVDVAIGLSKMRKIPFVSTFSAFFTRAFDQIRMAAYSGANIKFVGSHMGVSIGEDGPSQMGLEEIALFRSVRGSTILIPADAVSCAKLVGEAAEREGIVYIGTLRPETEVIYDNSESFRVGGSKILKESGSDKVTIVACGITVLEALLAWETLKNEKIDIRVIDAYSIKPIDEESIKKAAADTGEIICVEDHYFEGGLGDAVLNCLAGVDTKVYKLAVSKIPTSGKPSELLRDQGIDAWAIVSKVKEILAKN